MKVTGNLIKRRRNNYGMSQRDLAAGICAQATVSLIENRDNCPSLAILHPICYRLRLNLKSVVKVNRGIKSVERAILKKDFPQAKLILRRIPRRKFKERHRLGSYFCYSGILARVDADYYNATYYFNRVLSLRPPRDEFYQAWANLGLGEVYLKRHDPEKALEFIQVAGQKFNSWNPAKVSERFKLYISLRLLLVDMLGQLGRLTQANRAAYRTIVILTASHSMYRLADVYYQLNRNYLKLNRLKLARSALARARLFHKVYQAPGSLRD